MLSVTSRGWALAALLAAAGCAGGELSDQGGRCGSAADCPGETTCTLGWCVAPGENQVALRARILPPPGSGLLEQHVPELGLAAGPAVEVTLVEPVVLRGVVRHAGNPLATNVPGELEARTAGDVPGLDLRFTARSLEGVDADGNGYYLGLLPGRTYQVTFRPTDRSTPTHTFVLPSKEVVSGPRNIELPALSDYVELQAFVRLDAPTPTPIKGARVRITLPDGRGLPAVTTDEVNGWLSALLPPGTESVQLTVEAPAAGPLFPDTTTGWLTPRDGPAITVLVPPLPTGVEPFEAVLRVTAPGPDGAEVPAAGLSLALVGHLQDGLLRRTAVTDADGTARLQALPGAWEILVSVPPGPTFGSRIVKRNLGGAEPSTADIALPARAVLAGTVRDHLGGLVESGAVVATRRTDAAADDALALAPAPFTADIWPGGRFAMSVDPGTYDLRVTPGLATGAPAALVRGVIVEGDADLPVDLPAPGLARVTVAGPDGAWLPDVTVELYEGGVGGDGAATPERTPLVLSKGTTGPDGYVDLLVPFEP